ncbi:hypothetical protein M569_10791 [Genlisea aurea]|uniref:Phosphoacetylglucosamine mutase n=1 Tax=Genlisea aurea TaxID=192259 RepID=S8CAW0_9LAMI|nr:hypothetical protein M569_10791 [Genlisea aurea]
MNEEQRSALLNSSSLFPPPPGVKFSYGTSGFRADASLLESTVFRVGILAALRSIHTRSVIGLMITASHNRLSDNGIKVADPSGGMLAQNWEPFADAIANAPDPNSLVQLVYDFIKRVNIRLDEGFSAEVFLGRDTRPSGISLLEAAKQAKLGIISIIGSTFTDMGIVTTPQLHWMVRSRNKGGEASEQSYYNQLSTSFRCLLDYCPGEGCGNVDDELIVDAADGVGGEKLETLKSKLSLNVQVRNRGAGVLNDGVGADYVQKEKLVPRGFGPPDAGKRCASLDGDADRLVYFSVSSDGNAVDLVDGDKILSLFSVFLKEQLDVLAEEEEGGVVSFGVVQTAYANGASTEYLRRAGLRVACTPTGVKYLHEKAAEYDVGIYFEANGHGTVLFSDGFLSRLDSSSNAEIGGSEKKHGAAMRLRAVNGIMNQAVGDALSGVLLVEAVLLYKGWSIHQWSERLYRDLPSRQLKVIVHDRSVIETADAETRVVKPAGLQEAIDGEVAKHSPDGRCFVRPSGTEDVVRVYAEGSTRESADDLARSVASIVDRYLCS